MSNHKKVQGSGSNQLFSPSAQEVRCFPPCHSRKEDRVGEGTTWEEAVASTKVVRKATGHLLVLGLHQSLFLDPNLCGSRKDICKYTNAKATLRLEEGISQPNARPKGVTSNTVPPVVLV